jgi:hypothetical protein
MANQAVLDQLRGALDRRKGYSGSGLVGGAFLLPGTEVALKAEKEALRAQRSANDPAYAKRSQEGKDAWNNLTPQERKDRVDKMKATRLAKSQEYKSLAPEALKGLTGPKRIIAMYNLKGEIAARYYTKRESSYVKPINPNDPKVVAARAAKNAAAKIERSAIKESNRNYGSREQKNQ